jgi:hypothetical protein
VYNEHPRGRTDVGYFEVFGGGVGGDLANAFDHPSAWWHLETFGGVGSLDDLDSPFSLKAPAHDVAGHPHSHHRRRDGAAERIEASTLDAPSRSCERRCCALASFLRETLQKGLIFMSNWVNDAGQ